MLRCPSCFFVPGRNENCDTSCVLFYSSVWQGPSGILRTNSYVLSHLVHHYRNKPWASSEINPTIDPWIESKKFQSWFFNIFLIWSVQTYFYAICIPDYCEPPCFITTRVTWFHWFVLGLPFTSWYVHQFASLSFLSLAFLLLRKRAGRLNEVSPGERSENLEGVWGREGWQMATKMGPFVVSRAGQTAVLQLFVLLGNCDTVHDGFPPDPPVGRR